jgi:bifunctional non-homologous end joining protein LigD
MKVLNPIKPMLCDTKMEGFTDPDWIWEVKMDGIRAIIRIEGGKIASIQARSGEEKLTMFPDIVVATKIDCILDGEIVAATGKFNDIQHRSNRENGIAQAVKDYPAKFIGFDVIKAQGTDMTAEPLMKRQNLLQGLAIPGSTFEVSQIFTGGEQLYSLAEKNAWEGIVGKRLDSRYAYGSRSPNWLKVKVWKRDAFWVMGYTPGTGWRSSTFGALVLARVDMVKRIPVHVGEVGTGFVQSEIDSLNIKMKANPLPPGHIPFKYSNPVTWVAPFGVKIRYLELTNDGIVRFPSYKGLINAMDPIAVKAWIEEGL